MLMDRPTECAAEQTWQQFVAGTLCPSEHDLLQAHAANCSSCSELVQRLSQSKTALPGGSTATPAGSSLAGPALTRTKLYQTGQGEMADAPELNLHESSFDASLLNLPERPDSMGRLGKYDVLAVLGQGAFGVVLQAFDEQLRRSVAIKNLSREYSSSDTARRRVLRESRAAAGPCRIQMSWPFTRLTSKWEFRSWSWN